MQMRKIRELHSYFGQDLYIVTETDLAPPGEDEDSWNYILPANQIVSPRNSNDTLTSTLALNYICCGIERAIMYLIHNRESYDYAWVMEDDVLWSNMTDLADFFQSSSRDDNDIDLLHSNPTMETYSTYNMSEWWWYQYLLPPFISNNTAAQFEPPFHKGLFQFYRMSSHFASALNDWRLSNNGEWTFFEPLFANLAFRQEHDLKKHGKQLTTKSYLDNAIGYTFRSRFRPCFALDEVYNETARGGLFHPVKKDHRADNCQALAPIQWTYGIKKKKKSKSFFKVNY
jgi:hypothetical protein